MKRATPIVFAGLFAVAVGWLWAHRSKSESHRDDRAAAATAGGSRRPMDAGLGGAADLPGRDNPADGGAASADPALSSDAGGTLLDGGSVPDLVAESPKSVKFGVVLVRYAGAQGAPPGTRDREQAKVLAEKLATSAAEDFETAVEAGDPGSTRNAGRMFRGVLEPAPEFVLFSLDKGEVGGPVDTPRGYWIVKRID